MVKFACPDCSSSEKMFAYTTESKKYMMNKVGGLTLFIPELETLLKADDPEVDIVYCGICGRAGDMDDFEIEESWLIDCEKREMAIDIRLWDKEEERYLEWLERATYFVNCSTNKVYKYDRFTYYGGNAFTDVSDRYEVRTKERSNEV